MKNRLRALLPIACIFLLPVVSWAHVTVTVVNGDAAGVGFNDPTVVAPIGGNLGTTLGDQRMNVVTAAANKWGTTLTSAVTIRVNAKWAPLTCTESSGVVGSAGTTSIWRNFPNAPFANHWYGKALANKLAGFDLSQDNVDINATFNVNLGQSGCLTGVFFYLGLDNNHGNSPDLFTVVLHELAHGLGFGNFTSGSTGSFVGGFPSIWDQFLLDNLSLKTWAQMTPEERVASAISTGTLVWNGPNTAFTVPQVLQANGGTFIGTDSQGRARMHAPAVYQGGSSVSHFDSTMSPNQVMEPSYSSTLVHEVTAPTDLTFALLKDIGWNVGTGLYPYLGISKAHTGSFVRGQTGVTYNILVYNVGNVASSGTVTVKDFVPVGFFPTGISGSGWSCSILTMTCTRGEALAAAAAYPQILVTGDVAWNAPAQITNEAQVWGGGSVPASASDVTTVLPVTQVSSLGIFRTNLWAIDQNKNFQWDGSDKYFFLGQAGDVPVSGDFNGDGFAEIGIFRNGLWAIDQNGNGQWDESDKYIVLGQAGDVPVSGDFNGDGFAEMGIFRNGLWAIDQNGNGQWDGSDKYIVLGQAGDVPVWGDFDGDGFAEMGVFRNGLWAIDQNRNGQWDVSDKYLWLGQAGDIPVWGHIYGGSASEMGIFRNGLWAIDLNQNGVWDDSDLYTWLGQSGDVPIMGAFP